MFLNLYNFSGITAGPADCLCRSRRVDRIATYLASSLSQPYTALSVLGDGNCLFRSVSMFVTGTLKYVSFCSVSPCLKMLKIHESFT